MADQKISEMTAATSLADADIIPIVQGGVNKKAAFSLFGLGAVTTHTGTTWDGTPKYRELTGNLALTLSTSERTGFFIFKQDATGSRTLTINGTSVPIASGANNYSIVTFTYNDASSTYVVEYTTNIIGNVSGGDTTAPTLVSATIENATPSEIWLTYNEALDTVSIPTGTDFAIIKNGGSVVAGTVVVTGSTVKIGIAVAAVSTDVFTISYTAGVDPIQDVAGNNAANLSGQAITNNVSAGGYDADAQTIITAIEATDAGALSTGQKDAIDGLVVDMKAAGVWTGMKALYGYVGGTANSHLINWRTPGTYNLTWNGGVTHSANGVQFNGTTGYGDTGINDNTVLNLNSVAIGGYSRTNTNNGFMMGVHDNTADSLYLADQNPMSCRLHRGADIPGATTPTRLMIASRMSVAPLEAIYRDGTQLSVSSSAAGSKCNANIYIGAINSLAIPGATGFSDKEYALHFIYDGDMDATDVTAFTTAVNTFQTALTRNV